MQEFRSHVAEEAEKTSTLYGSFRESAFQVVAIVTTTGFGTADFDVWPTTLRLMLVLLMFFGGCAGSTGGGMKMIRILINLKAGFREIIKMARPRIIKPIKNQSTFTHVRRRRLDTRRFDVDIQLHQTINDCLQLIMKHRHSWSLR